MTLNRKRIRKHPFTGACELCHEWIIPPKKPVWHHFDDSSPQWGLWLCWHCHKLAECIEKDLDGSIRKRYLDWRTLVQA